MKRKTQIDLSLIGCGQVTGINTNERNALNKIIKLVEEYFIEIFDATIHPGLTFEMLNSEISILTDDNFATIHDQLCHIDSAINEPCFPSKRSCNVIINLDINEVMCKKIVYAKHLI